MTFKVFECFITVAHGFRDEYIIRVYNRNDWDLVKMFKRRQWKMQWPFGLYTFCSILLDAFTGDLKLSYF